MSESSNFWTPASKLEFHQNVGALNVWNREPAPAEQYQRRVASVSDQHVLLYGEEQHIADHLAFLAHSEEGARNVSAVMVEEHASRDGLTIRLAANETPSKNVLDGLSEILGILEAYATKGRSREMYCEKLFDKVVHFSCQRIHQRLRSKKSPRPWWIPLTQPSLPPLYLRVRKQVQILLQQSRYRSKASGTFYSDLEDLARCYEDVDSFDSDVKEHELLKKAVTRSFEISTTGYSQSLEEHLKSLGYSLAVYQSREVLEIDKIARYLGLCKDLIRFSRRTAYRPLFINITVEHCISLPATVPNGATKPCHVHGEVRLILHYEKYPHHPQPRAIGSSKSACLLCDLFIKNHGQYSVSHSHKRLYHQWTIPDVDWMTEQQVARFRIIIQAMINQLITLRRSCRRQPENRFKGFESRAHLLDPALKGSGASTPSVSSQLIAAVNGSSGPTMTPPDSLSALDSTKSRAEVATLPNTVGTANSQTESVASSSAESFISVTHSNLPFKQLISLKTPSLHLQVEHLSINIEFVAVLSGSLSIGATEDELHFPSTDCHTLLDISDIPTASDIRLSCASGANELTVRFKMSQTGFISIVFVWD